MSATDDCLCVYKNITLDVSFSNGTVRRKKKTYNGRKKLGLFDICGCITKLHFRPVIPTFDWWGRDLNCLGGSEVYYTNEVSSKLFWCNDKQNFPF